MGHSVQRRDKLISKGVDYSTTEVSTQSNLKTLQAFGDAWNRRDLDGVMSYMTDGCVFNSPAGPELMGKSASRSGGDPYGV